MNDGLLPGLPAEAAQVAYRVLARKYRPTGFEELIGQDALVRTLTNAIAAGRIAQAFMLTGVRGVGKTTTARIIARALNCIGADGTGGPTVTPCGVCQNCVAIAADRHVDVVELDAASNNGIDNIREIIEQVRYRPVMARYKIYIFDEVHMLSTPAFNGLLKTLEEPPPHAKFIFATTEIRKVPVTVLSRCQRFDLRRVDSAVLSKHFARVAAAEGATVEPDALALIARAADGSVRDGLSLLDQAIARAGESAPGAGATVAADQVRDMLGLADRVRVFDLLEATLGGDAALALEIFGEMHTAGVDPVVVVQDLLDLVHWVTRARVAPAAAAEDASVAEAERLRGRALADALPMPELTRAWQMLLKGLGEAQHAPMPKLAVDMLLVRLAYAARLPTPAEIIERLGSGGAPAAPAGKSPSVRDEASPAPIPVLPPPATITNENAPPLQAAREAGDPGPGSSEWGEAGNDQPLVTVPPALQPAGGPRDVAPEEAPVPARLSLATLADLAAFLADRREALLHTAIVHDVHPLEYRPGFLRYRPAARSSPMLASDLRKRLRELTDMHWDIAVSESGGGATLAERAANRQKRLHDEAIEHPLVQAALAAFPGAKVEAVRSLSAAEPEPSDPDLADLETVDEEPDA